MMVSATTAGQLLGGLSRQTLHEYAATGVIPAERIGRRGIIRFDLDLIRKFAQENKKFFNESLAAQLLAQASK